MQSRRLLLIAGIATLAMGAGAFALRSSKTAAPGAPPPRSVSAAKAEMRDVPLTIEEIGNTTASENASVQAQVAGQIIEVHFADGAEVKQGDPLFSIDARPYQAALDKAQATLAQDSAKVAYQRVQMSRMESLREKKVASPQDFDQAAATLSEQEAIVRGDQAAVETARLNLEFCTVRAPITGRAGKRLVDRGNLVAYPGGPSLVTIAKQDPLFIDFTIAEEKLSAVRAYQERGTLSIEISVADDAKKRRKGEFIFLDNTVQNGNGTVRLRGRVPNADRVFWPGQFVNVRLVLDIAKDAVVVPSQAVQVGQIGTFVFVVNPDQTVAIRPVRPGQKQGSDVLIEDGVKPGEMVVVTGQLFLAPGAPVRIVPGPGSTPTPAAAKADAPPTKPPTT